VAELPNYNSVEASVAKIELGTKRQCQECGSRFYDLGRDPVVCPKCGAIFQVAALKPRASSAREDVEEDRELEPAAPAAELVPLEEADAPSDAAVVTDDADIDADIDDSDDDGTFLEPDEEDGDDDVSDLIDGDLDEDDEN
jgi:uncharacterized protein (TIGR02300 family)